eukprot:1878134-Rhodomonas_salina.1
MDVTCELCRFRSTRESRCACCVAHAELKADDGLASTASIAPREESIDSDEASSEEEPSDDSYESPAARGPVAKLATKAQAFKSAKVVRNAPTLGTKTTR